MQFGFNILCPERDVSVPRAPFETNLFDLCCRIRRENEILFSVLSTYSLDWTYTQRVCAELFSSAPALILHGDRKKAVVGLPIKEPQSQHQFQFKDHIIRLHEVNPHIFSRRSQSSTFGIKKSYQKNVKAGGVHHSKYILVFCKDKLIVVILTANLVPQTSIDTIWMQEFPARPAVNISVAPSNEEMNEKSSVKEAMTIKNEFGAILEHFLRSVRVSFILVCILINIAYFTLVFCDSNVSAWREFQRESYCAGYLIGPQCVSR
jgi:hypothetical protein